MALIWITVSPLAYLCLLCDQAFWRASLRFILTVVVDVVNLHFIIYMGGKGINGLFALIGHLTITSATYQQPQNLHMRINDRTFHCISSAVIF